MITGSYDGSTLKFYINGQLVRTLAITGPVNYSTDPLYFGTTGSLGQNFKGNIDDIGIWNRALSASEILGLYTAITAVPALSDNSSDFLLFPNPSKDKISLTANAKMIGQGYSIYDSNGNLVVKGKLNAEVTEINLSAFAAGNYSIGFAGGTTKAFIVVK